MLRGAFAVLAVVATLAAPASSPLTVLSVAEPIALAAAGAVLLVASRRRPRR